MNISLRPVNRENFEAVVELSVREDQQSFVASNVFSIAQAKVFLECVPLCVYHEELLVGFVMYALDSDDHEYWIYRLMVDKAYQSLGYGRAAVAAVIARIRAEKAGARVFISAEPENSAARHLYESMGFAADGRVIDGEVVYCLND